MCETNIVDTVDLVLCDECEIKLENDFGIIDWTMKKGDKVYRNVFNQKCNDWNDEPEYIAIPYEIINETEKSFLVVRSGWGKGKKQQHHLPKNEFYPTKEIAQKHCK